MMNKIIGGVLFFCFVFGNALGQDKEYKREKFVDHFLKQITASGATKSARDFVKNKLEVTLLDPTVFQEERFQQMANTVDAIVKDRHKIYPVGFDYVVSMYYMTTEKISAENYKIWHNVVNELIERRNPRVIEEFLTKSNSFFSENVVAVNRNFKWFCSGNNYTFSYKNRIFYIQFDKATLQCKTLNQGRGSQEYLYSDSIKISNTQGIIDFKRGEWKGEGGIFTWEKVGLPASETYAELGKYDVSFNATILTADSVTVTTPYINEPVVGRLIDRALKGAGENRENIPFPKFKSYQANFNIKNIVKGVEYKGGFSMVSDEFVGIGNDKQPAQLTYYRKEIPFVKTYSSQVIIGKERLRTPMARFVLLLQTGDSIVHPILDVEYDITSEKLSAKRGSNPASQAPFVDSYHKMNLYVGNISWIKSNEVLQLGYGRGVSKSQREAQFESINYYNEKLFRSIQGGSTTNPLTTLYNYAYKYDRFTMTEGKAATAFNMTIQQAKPQLLKLSALGFLNYNTERGIVVLTEKTVNFVKANSGKIDYDNISFSSNLVPINIDRIPAENATPELIEKLKKRNQKRSKIDVYATIDISSLEMKINAVDRITISDRKRTSIFPSTHEVIVGQNRKLTFDGWIRSGKWEIKIEDGNYSYEGNKFNIFESSMAFFHVNPLRAEDGKQPIALQSNISGIKGELIVDDVNNRAGLNREFRNYPILISNEKSRVYYDYEELYKGAYVKEEFYFELEPFKVDSLMTFNEKKIGFSGKLVSAGIFPAFKEDLIVMPDYSLGFIKDSPEAGYPFYETDSRYKNKIFLSNNGLQGAGTIEFLNSISKSKELFTFLPDSTVGLASFVNEPQSEGVQFPDAVGEDVYITYIPDKKRLLASSNEAPITMFEEDANLYGTTIVEPTGMRGIGILKFDKAKMLSQNFNFTRWKAKADTSDFQLTNRFADEDERWKNPFSFVSENVKGDLDFKKRKGVFISNQGESIVKFPVNQYVCKIDKFTWLMDKDEMSLEQDVEKDKNGISLKGGLDLAGSNFFSVRKDQDSLQFKSPKAVFDLKEKVIHASGVEYIRVGDARIFPDSGEVVVRKQAVMDTLFDAKIIANYVTKYHTITNVSASITGRKAYTASGDYVYGNVGGEKQLIHFNNIRLDTSFQTIATGDVAQEQKFKLGEQFAFYGKAHLTASQPYLNFDGATKLIHNCENFKRSWMAFKAPIDPENIQIPIPKEMVNLEGEELSVGIRWRNSTNTDSVSMYPTFLSKVDIEGDPSVISASGYLQFSKGTDEFQIASKEKLTNRGAKGNFISLHTKSCSMHGVGSISLGMQLGEMETEAIGVVDYNQSTGQTSMNVTLILRAPVDNKLFEQVGEKIAEVEGLKAADFSSTTLEQALIEVVGQEESDKIKSDYTLKKKFNRVPKALEDAIVITGLRLNSYTKSGDPQRGIISSVSQAAIVNVFNQPVMKYVPFRLFAQQRMNVGDYLGMLWDVPGAYSYFFNYDYRKDGILSILTNDEEFGGQVMELKKNKRSSKDFIYQISNQSVYKSQFLRVFK